MLKLLTALGLTLTLLLAACGGGDDDAGGNGPGDATGSEGSDRDDADGNDDSEFPACSLLTREEVGAAVEEEMMEGRDHGGGVVGATACTWESTEGPTVVFVEVLIEDGQRLYDVAVQGASPGQLQELDGLGDVARWDAFLGTVEVVDDNRYVSVQAVIVLSEVDKKAAALKLAAMAVERLP